MPAARRPLRGHDGTPLRPTGAGVGTGRRASATGRPAVGTGAAVAGTPAGVGNSRKPPIFLKAKDIVECEIEGIGMLRNPVENEA